MKTPLSSSAFVNGSGLGEFGGDFGLPTFGESWRDPIRLDGFDSFWASFSSLKYSSPDENGRGGVTRSGQLWMRLLVSSIHESVIDWNLLGNKKQEKIVLNFVINYFGSFSPFALSTEYFISLGDNRMNKKNFPTLYDSSLLIVLLGLIDMSRKL